MTKGWVGVWNGPKKDDVIYDQPLSLSSIPLEQFLPILALFPSKFSQLIQGYGSALPYTWVLCKDDVGAPLSKLFPENVIYLEGVKNDWFPPMYPDFNILKKVENYNPNSTPPNLGMTRK